MAPSYGWLAACGLLCFASLALLRLAQEAVETRAAGDADEIERRAFA